MVGSFPGPYNSRRNIVQFTIFPFFSHSHVASGAIGGPSSNPVLCFCACAGAALRHEPAVHFSGHHIHERGVVPPHPHHLQRPQQIPPSGNPHTSSRRSVLAATFSQDALYSRYFMWHSSALPMGKKWDVILVWVMPSVADPNPGSSTFLTPGSEMENPDPR